MVRIDCKARLRLVCGTAIFSIGMAPNLVMAQTAGSPTETDATVPDIVVTGQKRSESVQNVPKQVAVASQAELVDAGVNRLTDLQNAFPTITATSNGAGGTPRPPGIRGISPFTFSVGVQSQTGIVVDDVPQATFSTLPFELADVERVEVFAGPQTTLSGRNASAGLINIVTRSPSFTPELDFTFEQTTDHQTRGTIFATGPITKNLAYSMSLLLNDWAGPYRNGLLGNERLGGFKTRGARGKLLWEPTNWLKTTLVGFYLQTDQRAIPVLPQGAVISGPNTGTFVLDAQQRPLTIIYPGLRIGPDNRSVYSPTDGSAQTRDKGFNLKIDADTGALGTASSITSYTVSAQPRTDAFLGAPRDNLVFPITDFTANADVQSKNFSQELRVTSSSSERFTYLIGGIYSRIRLHQIYLRRQVFPFSGDQYVNTDSAALFGRATYDVTPANSITAGLRYQHDKLAYVWNVLTAGNTVSRGSNSYGFWGGEASYKHKFGEDVNVYVTYSQAQTGNAYNLNDTVTASTGASLPVIPSTHVNNWEAGIKSKLFDRMLTFNFDVFRARYSNFQVQDTRITGNTLRTDILAIGRVQTQGVELEASLRPNRDLTLGVTGAYIDAKVTDYPNAACYIGQTAALGCITVAPGVTNQGNIAGHQLPFSPKWRLTASGDYTVHLSTTDLTLGAFYRYQGRSTSDLFGDPTASQKGYGVLNLTAGIADPKGRWSVQLYVNNVFDKRYYSAKARSQLVAPVASDNPVVFGQYDRNSFRYGGIRTQLKF